MKQIALAAHDFHARFERFPPGYLGPDPNVPTLNLDSTPDQSYIGVLAFLLPSLDQTAVYEMIPDDQRNLEKLGGVRWFVDPATNAAAQARLPVFVCPSTDPYQSAQGIISRMHAYRTSTEGVFEGRTLGLTPVYGRTNYLGVAGELGPLPGFDKNKGVLYNRSRIRVGDITDGSTNVLMFGEALGEFSDHKLQHSHAWMGCAVQPSHWGFGQRVYHQFSSQHAGTLTFALADGSARNISEAINAGVFLNLTAIGDGNVVGDF
jgi:hypothetical protein